MKDKRITIDQARERWEQIRKQIKLVSRTESAVLLPQIDLKKIFGNRKAMSVKNLVSEISAILNEWSAE